MLQSYSGPGMSPTETKCRHTEPYNLLGIVAVSKQHKICFMKANVGTFKVISVTPETLTVHLFTS